MNRREFAKQLLAGLSAVSLTGWLSLPETREKKPIVNVSDYGAKGNGLLETEAIQAAYDAVQDGGIVYFPPGDYRHEFLKRRGKENVRFVYAGLPQKGEDEWAPPDYYIKGKIHGYDHKRGKFF